MLLHVFFNGKSNGFVEEGGEATVGKSVSFMQYKWWFDEGGASVR